jgi:phage tail-like protein
MAARQYPFSQFNFRVDINGGPPPGDIIHAGFQEVAGLGMEVHVAEYRPGNSQENSPMKVPGTYKVNDVTLKRGVFGEIATLYQWIYNVRIGNQDKRTVTIELLDENRNSVQKWVLTNAFPTKLSGPALTGKGTDVAIEELTLAAEVIEEKLS